MALNRKVGDSMDGPFVAAAGNNEVVPTAAGNPVLLRAPSDGTYLLYFTNYRYYGKAMHTLALSRSLSLFQAPRRTLSLS